MWLFIFGEILSIRKNRYTAEQMLAGVKMADAGTPVVDVCRELGISHL